MSTTTVPGGGRVSAPRQPAGGRLGTARPAMPRQGTARPAPAPPRPAGVAPRSRRSPRAPFVLLVLALLAGGLATMLLLNTVLAQGAFTQARLEKLSSDLSDQEQELTGQLAELKSPEHLAKVADKQGLVTSCPAFLYLKTRKVLGQPCPAAPSPTPAASGSASASAPATASTGAAQ